MADRRPLHADDKGKGKATARPMCDPVPAQPEPKRRKAGSSSKSERAEEPGSKSRRELQDDLTERGIKTTKSASKAELRKLLDIVAGLTKAAGDMGTCSSPLQIALCTNAFYKNLGAFSYLGLLSMVSKSYRAILVSRMAWEQVALGMDLISKKLAREVLALPDGRIAEVDGPTRIVHTIFGLKTTPPNKLFAQDAVRHALEFHGSAEQMYLARGKKTETRRKNALKPKKPRAPRRSRTGMAFDSNAGMLALMMSIFRGIGGLDDYYDDDYDDDDEDDEDFYFPFGAVPGAGAPHAHGGE